MRALHLVRASTVGICALTSLAAADQATSKHHRSRDSNDTIRIELTVKEREVIHLAVDGYINDLTLELAGVSSADPPFSDRAGKLSGFIPIVENLRTKIPGDTGRSEEVTLNHFERIAVSIMMEIWNPRDGTLAHHTEGVCQRSREIQDGDSIFDLDLCDGFQELADAARSVQLKVSRDQNDPSLPEP